MKYYIAVFILAAICIVGAGCEQPESVHKPQAGSEPAVKPAEESEAPLLLDDKPLLLLDDEPDSGQSEGPEADNSRCFVCHINYMQEDIAVSHARANIGCASCHATTSTSVARNSNRAKLPSTSPRYQAPA